MARHETAIALAALLAVGSTGNAFASEYSIEGDARSLTLVAKQASRVEIVEALAERFELGISGAAVGEGEVSGRYEGTLSHVLKAILPDRSYAIAYRGGQPFRISFTGTGSGMAGASMIDNSVAANMGVQPTAPASAAPSAAQSPMGGMDGASGTTLSGLPSAETVPSPSSASSMDDMTTGGSEDPSAASAPVPSPAPSASPSPSPSEAGPGATTTLTDQPGESPVPGNTQPVSTAKPDAGQAPIPSPEANAGPVANTEGAPSPSLDNSAAGTDAASAGISTEAPVGFKGPGMSVEADEPDGTDTALEDEGSHSSRPPM